MQNELVDKKISVIFDNYKDKHYAREAQRDVERIRNKASNIGITVTTSAFILNEAARITMRSRKLLHWPHTNPVFSIQPFSKLTQ